MEGLFGATGRFIFEMRRAAELCEGSAAYRWMYRNYGTVKWCLYGLVVLLNVNLLMVTYGGLAGPQNGLNGYDHIIESLGDPEALEGGALSLTISLLLAVVNILGYLAVLVFLGLSEVRRNTPRRRGGAHHVLPGRPRSPAECYVSPLPCLLLRPFFLPPTAFSPSSS